MADKQKWLAILLVLVAGIALTACQQSVAKHATEHPAEVTHIDGSDLSIVTLTAKAAQRIGLQTGKVAESQVTRTGTIRKVVPYSSLIYDPHGQTWIYTSPESLSFVRHKVDVDFIEGDTAVLNDGPPTGTVVASVGVAEIYGTEFDVGH